MTFTTTVLIATWFAIAMLALAVAGLLRQVAALRGGGWVEPELGPAHGTPAPDLAPDVQVPAPALLLFADRDCEGCAEVLPVFSRLASNGERGQRRYVAVFANDHTDGGLDPDVLTVTNADEAFRSYRVPVTPFAVAVGADGHIVASGPVGASDLLEDFATDTRRR